MNLESIGCNELADEIRKDYTAYFDPTRYFALNASAVYQQIGDAVLDAHGKASFEEVVAFVADNNGMVPARLLSRYRKLRTVYDEALKDHYAMTKERPMPR